MNEARRQAARPGDFGGGQDGGRKLPNEVKAMARQMGIPASELANADGMWQKLTKMSEEDPDGYSELLTESAKHMAKANGDELAEGMEPDDAKANELMSKLMTPDALTPAAGYVIKAALKYNGGKLMINCCAHPALQPPNDAAGLPVDVTSQKPGWSSASGLQIPMVVGSARPCAVAGAGDKVGSGQAIDVLFHPWVLDQVAAEGPRSPFKRDVSALAVRWVAAESKLAVDTDAKSWKHINSKYKGGGGKAGDEPVAFPLDAVSFQSAPPGSREMKKAPPKDVKPSAEATGVAASPESLLARARGLAADREKENGLAMKMPETAAQKKKKVMIQEVAPDDALEASTDGFDISSDAPAKPKKPAVKKGFLAGDKAKHAKPLYPNGSCIHAQRFNQASHRPLWATTTWPSPPPRRRRRRAPSRCRTGSGSSSGARSAPRPRARACSSTRSPSTASRTRARRTASRSSRSSSPARPFPRSATAAPASAATC